MSKLITRIKRFALALCLATPFVSRAVTTTDYEDFGDTAGVILWRGTQNDFHASTVADVAADGSVGDEYTMNTAQWHRFASNQTQYVSPGVVLVYDTPGTDQGYKYNPDCSFAPLSFGGMWVKTLAINGLPFSIIGSGDRRTEFGAVGKSTLFKFDASYTINRQGTTTFYGDATVDIAQGATFTAQAYSGQAVAVDSAATLKLKGAGTLAVTTMNVAGTLDLSAATVPSISGNVAFAGYATLVLPAGTNPTTEAPLTVCSGALSAAGVVYVKVGDAEPEEAELTISGGTITKITTGIQTEQTFTSDYPAVVPVGYTYTYEATEAVTIPAVTVNGTLKTSGPITITDLDIANGADFEVVAGNTIVNCSADCKLKGNIKIDADATLTNSRTDSLDWGGAMTVDVYGTLAMGSTRWSIPGGCTFKLQNGAQVTGAGDGWASLDFINGASKGLDVYGSATIEGKMRVRKNETRIWINGGATLVLSSGIADGGGHHAGFKQVGPGTLEIHANSTGLSGNASIMTQGTLRLVDTTLAFPVDLQGSSALEVVATDSDTTVPVNVTVAGNGVTFSGEGKVNGTITKTSAPSGDLATALQSAAWTGTFVADWAGASNAQFDINAYGNANSVVEVTKLAGGYVSGSNANVTVVPTVKVSGTMTLNNGYSGKVTTLTKLTGSGVFSNQTYSVDITTLDNFTGTLVPLIDAQYVGMKIGTINLSTAPDYGDRIVNLGGGANIGNIGNTKVSVNGVVDDSLPLEVKSDGIYVKVPPVASVGTSHFDSVQGAVDAVIGGAVEGTVIVNFTTTEAVTIALGNSIKIAAATADVNISGITVSVSGEAAIRVEVAEDGITYTAVESVAYIRDGGKYIYFASIEEGLADSRATALAPLTLSKNVTLTSALEIAVPATGVSGGKGINCNGKTFTVEGGISLTKGTGDDAAYFGLWGSSIVGNITIGNDVVLFPQNAGITGSVTFGDSGLYLGMLTSSVAGFSVTGSIVLNGQLSVAGTPSGEGPYLVMTGTEITIGENASVSVGENDNWVAEVVGTDTKTLQITAAVASVGGENYETMSAAVAAAKAADNATIALLANVGTVTIDVGDVLNIKLNGFVVTVDSSDSDYYSVGALQDDGVTTQYKLVAYPLSCQMRYADGSAYGNSMKYKTIVDVIPNIELDSPSTVPNDANAKVTFLTDLTETGDVSLTSRAWMRFISGSGTKTWTLNGTLTLNANSTLTVPADVKVAVGSLNVAGTLALTVGSANAVTVADTMTVGGTVKVELATGFAPTADTTLMTWDSTTAAAAKFALHGTTDYELEVQENALVLKPKGINPVSIPVFDNEEAAQAAAAMPVMRPSSAVVAVVSSEEYGSYFTKTVVQSGDDWTLKLGLTDDTAAAINASAMDIIDEVENAIVVPAGLYYKITTLTALDGTGTTTVVGSGLSDGTGVSVTKPGDTQGFIKVEVDVKSIE